jgi:hypothetical protein
MIMNAKSSQSQLQSLSQVSYRIYNSRTVEPILKISDLLDSSPHKNKNNS